MTIPDKETVIRILEEIAVFLELKNENPFKVRAYQNAARVLEGRPEDLKTLIETGRLEELRGIGPAISGKIRELMAKGKLEYYEELRKSFPESLLEFFRIQGLGPKRVKILYDQLKIKSVKELSEACKDGRLAKLEGFGEKTCRNILKGIEQHRKSEGLSLISTARHEAELLKNYLMKIPEVKRIEIAGSIRRHKELIHDIDLLAAGDDAVPVHEAFARYPKVARVLAHGGTKSSVTLKNGINADLRTVTAKEFPFALYYFTGSKEHNVEMRGLAKKAGYKINEYGLFKGARLIPCKDEEELFKKLGFSYIPPELREACGEFEFFKIKKSPVGAPLAGARFGREQAPPLQLITEQDIRGIFHVHSTYSDGTVPLEEMIAGAEKLGYEYVGISDHSQSAHYAKGLEPERLKVQAKEIEKLRKKFKIRIFWGIESDILADGKLDYPDSILREFDFIIGSIHSNFNFPEEKQTRRILKAMDSKYLTFVGHLTGRLLLSRSGYALTMDKILKGAKSSGVSIELNANPRRLDIDWRFCRTAKEMGIPIGIHPDAHSLEGLRDTVYGVGAARKGWLEKKDVVNTKSVPEIEKFLKQKK